MKMLINPLEMLTIEIIEAGQKLISSYNRKKEISPKGFYLGNSPKLYNGLEQESLFLSREERMANNYCCGGTGSGKTTLIESYIQDDILQNRGFCLADAHGDVAEKLIRYLASLWWKKEGKQKEKFVKHLIIAEPFNHDRVVGFNPLEVTSGSSVYSCTLEMMNVFKARWPDFGPRMEELFRTCLVTLAENKLTLLEMPILLTSKMRKSGNFANWLVESVE